MSIESQDLLKASRWQSWLFKGPVERDLDLLRRGILALIRVLDFESILRHAVVTKNGSTLEVGTCQVHGLLLVRTGNRRHGDVTKGTALFPT